MKRESEDVVRVGAVRRILKYWGWEIIEGLK